MGKGSRSWNRWRKDSQRKKKERDRKQALERGQARKAASKG